MAVSVATGQPYIFISYASADRERVLSIVDALTRAGIAVWRDQESIAGGTSYGPAIAAAIRESVAVFVLCSDASLASRNVRQEVAIAWKHERPCLPLLLDPITTLPEEVEYWLEGAQWIEVLDHPEDVWLPKVVAALTRLGVTAELAVIPIDRTSASVSPSPATAQVMIPTPLTELVGRHRELAAVATVLRTHRLVTLIGPGGIGKTRLALAVGQQLGPQFADGAVWVDLSPLGDAALVIPTVAAALGVQPTGGDTVQTTLARAIGSRHLLLISDNWEQVIDAAPEMSTLLRACPNLHIIATSRVPLKIAGEREFAVEPLAVPDAGSVTSALDLRNVGDSPSVRLFVARAQSVKARFEVTSENAAAIVGICRRLDGIPLAIELAAARTKVLAPQAILQRLAHPLAVLTGGARDAPERQHTMRGAIQWSYDLLTDAEQRLFRRFSVFVGGWTQETADIVMSSDRDDSVDLLDGLTSLVEASLIVHHDQPDGTTRYRMLVPIREFAAEQLDRAGETATYRKRHADAIRTLVAHAEPIFRVWDTNWIDAVERDHDNIRAALGWAQEHDETAFGLEVIGHLRRFWFAQGYLDEGSQWADIFLGRPQPPTRWQGLAALCRSFLALGSGHLDGAHQWAAEAIQIGRTLDDVAILAEGLLLECGSMTLRTPVDDAAVQHGYRHALALIEQTDLDWLQVVGLNMFGVYERRAGRLDHATTLLTQMDDIATANGWNGVRAWSQSNLGACAARRGAQHEAVIHLRESWRVNPQGTNRIIGIASLTVLAEVLIALEQFNHGVRLLAVVDRSRRMIGAVWATEAARPEAIEAARKYLGPAAFEEEWRIGSQMSMPQAIAFALEVTDGLTR